MQINCIAVDDEPLALERMKEYIERVEILNCLAYIDNGIDALSFIQQNKVDLVFLDIQMSNLSGIELLETLSKKPLIVFTTAYENYALQGYELNVTDYLLKPISFKRFLKSIDKIVDILHVKKDDSKIQIDFANDIPENEYIFLKVDNKMQKVLFEDILYVEAMKDYVKIWTSAGKILFLCNIKNFMDKIPDNQFVRIHKSYAIAFNKIDAIKHKHVEIAGKDIPIGSTYRNLFFNLLRSKGLI